MKDFLDLIEQLDTIYHILEIKDNQKDIKKCSIDDAHL